MHNNALDYDCPELPQNIVGGTFPTELLTRLRKLVDGESIEEPVSESKHDFVGAGLALPTQPQR